MPTLRLCVPFVLLASLACAQKPAKADPAALVKAAGTDVAKLEQLAADWTAQKRGDGARIAWKRLIELQADHEAARAGLGHVRYDGKWFEGQTALFDYKRAEDARMGKQGLARAGDHWVPLADAPFVRLGWSKDAQGKWQHPLASKRLAHDAAMAAKGCQQQDLEWIDPSEFETWKQGLWKCGDQWLDTAAANAWHAAPERPWIVESEHFLIGTTVDRERVEWVKWYADRTWDDLVRIFGIAPGQRPSATDLHGKNGDKPELIVWNGLPQYNAFAGNAESRGLSSLHYACFCDAWFDDTVKPAAFAGLGCGFWDAATPTLAAFGQHSIRHAAAQAFVEAIDPSWKALGDLALDKSSPPQNQNAVAARAQAQSQAFWSDKRIPHWLRFGACSYVERWFVEKDAAEGVDPRWARSWALESLRKAGGLRDLNKVFECKLASSDAANSTQLIHESGLVVAFVLDGGDPRVQKAHQGFQQALAGTGSTAAAVAELQKALLAAKPALLAFAAR
jgi:hypothetical protein